MDQPFYRAGTYLKCESLRKAGFRIFDMNCAICKSIIEKQLKGEQSIKWIDFDFIIPHTVFCHAATTIPSPYSYSGSGLSNYRRNG